MTDDNKGLVTITRHEYEYLDARDAFLEHAFDLIPCLDEMWEDWYKENCDE